MGGIGSKQMDNDCKSWLSMAENYLTAGLTDKAKPLLEKVIAKYPDSDYAATTRGKLAGQ